VNLIANNICKQIINNLSNVSVTVKDIITLTFANIKFAKSKF